MASSPRSSRFLRRLPGMGRASAVIACGAVALSSACGHSPGNTAAKPPDHAYAESLVISLADARRIANFEGLQPYSYADRHDPPRETVGNPPAPCRAVGSTDLTFAGGWKEYRSVAYSGSTDDLRPGGIAPINEITNTVVIYPDAAAAGGALNQLHTTLDQCAALHHNAYDFALNKPDSATLKLGSDGWIHLYTVKSSVLVSVGVLGIEPTEQVADTVLRTVTDRIK
ncbi:sensor domain-containing protein [Mycobacterium seoulense]|uniref:sensor domain-containing protein n=1 Tax=Mycobacterium seoulense TaxID=386911 RepID=UPI003CFACFDE